ncbi:Protein FAR-RED IMPAIRED RESPONSE [Arachis hypogaea]|nr:Protein FAR-RED IMPAIRED RESPONSE [Arachis hypogaea]
MKKIPNKLNGYKRHDKINQEMSHVVWNSYTKDAFDRNWNDFITKCGLEGNKWLSGNQGFNSNYFHAHTFFFKTCNGFDSPDFIGSVYYAELYEDQHIWILIYLDHHFWTGMRSTQRSESLHSFFNKFITRNSSLRQFVKQYDNCLASREQTEREFDVADFYTVIPCATKSAIEAQFQHVYIHEKCRKVQAQFRGKVNCITRSMHSTLSFTTYEVIEQVSNFTFNKFFVTYDAVSQEVKCQCLLFESKGILCRHSLSVLSFERVDKVAPKYILERWSKNIKRRYIHIKSSQDEPLLEPRSKRFDELVFRSHNICEFAFESEELTRILHRVFDKVMADMQEYQDRSKGKSLLSHEEATLSDVNDLQSPPHVKTRGRPKNRLGSSLEKKDLKCYEEKEKDSSK